MRLDEPLGAVLRPRRDEVVTYRLRVDLVSMRPPLWRRLELASDLDLDLDTVHEILQAAFGWSDSHLHRFSVPTGKGAGYPYGDPFFLSSYDVEEGEVGTPEADVRLDEVLADDGDRLSYLYDFGDDWRHLLRLEAVLPRDGGAPRARCTGGRRAGVVEDAGEWSDLKEADAPEPTAFDVAEVDQAVRLAAG